MPRQTLILNRFDGGVNSKDSYGVRFLVKETGFDKDVKDKRALKEIRDISPRVSTITQNQQDLPDNFLVKADNLMVDSIGKLRVMGSFISDNKVSSYAPTPIAGRGLLFFRADYNYAGTNQSTSYIALIDSTGSLYLYKDGAWDLISDLSTGAMSPLMFFIDGALRIIDSGFVAKPKWFGYIKRKHFNDNNEYDGWYLENNDLLKPQHLAIRTLPENVSLTSGEGFDIIVSVYEESGYIGAGTYQVATSFIYDNNQESLLKIPTSNNTFEIEKNYSRIKCTVYAKSAFDKRITGARVYYRKNNTDDDWALLLDIDINDGVRVQIGSSYSSWTQDLSLSSSHYYAISNYIENIQVDTYETLNGYSQKEESNSIGISGMGYKDACVVNRRVFAVAPKYKDENGEVVFHGDRIIYSEAGRIDTFLSNNYIDIGINDGDEFIAVESFANRLLVFKRKKLYVITIQSALDVGWNLEFEYDNRGVKDSNAVVKLDSGIAWVNEGGLFFFDGKQIYELSQNIGYKEWYTDFYSSNISIAYLPKRMQLLILKDFDCSSSNDSDVYLYDFRTKSFVVGLNRLTNNGAITNFQINEDEDLICYKDGAHDIYKWRDLLTSNSSSFEYISKEIDFGDKSRKKKIYAFYLDYKLDIEIEALNSADDTLDNGVFYSIDGGSTYTMIDQNLTVKSSFGKLKFSLSAIKCNTLMIRIKSTSSVNFQLQSIEIDFRALSNRKVS